MAKFPKKEKIETLIQAVEQAISSDEVKEACEAFKDELISHYGLDDVENVKKGSWKSPMADARKAVGKIDEDYRDFLSAEWNERDLRDEQGNWVEQEEGQTITPAPVPTPNKPINHYVTGEDLEMVNQALDWSGMSEEEFIRKALVSYAKNFRPHTMVNTEEMTNEELRKSRKAGTAEELIKRAIDAIIEWNESQPEIQNRYQITVNSVKRLAGSRASIIKKVLDEQAEKIHTHHEHKVSHDPLWNRGKPEISEKIGGFSF